MNWSQNNFASLALALGLGLLIGVERERRKGTGPTRHFAGIRTFSLVSLAGALAQALNFPWITLVAGMLVATLAVTSHMKDHSKDPGVTTEMALFVTFLLGMLAVEQPAMAGACGVVVATLLAAREPLQRFSTQTLSESELHDALLLAGSVLIVLPLAPNQPLAWLGGLNPRTVCLLVVLIMGVQAVGHVALRLFGARMGLSLSGLVAGFVSSTATIAAMGARVSKNSLLHMACVAGAWFSTVSTSLQVGLIALVLQPSSLRTLGASLACALLTALALGVWALRRSQVLPEESRVRGRAFSLTQSIGLAVMLSGITVAVSWVQAMFGAVATLAATALAGFADMHSPVAAVMTLSSHGSIDAPTLWMATLLAFSTNSVSKVFAAYAAGGKRFGNTVSLGLLAVVAAAWLPWATAWLWG
jgi:uncharacterized membrane protein (DUF4010 family)